MNHFDWISFATAFLGSAVGSFLGLLPSIIRWARESRNDRD